LDNALLVLLNHGLRLPKLMRKIALLFSYVIRGAVSRGARVGPFKLSQNFETDFLVFLPKLIDLGKTKITFPARQALRPSFDDTSTATNLYYVTTYFYERKFTKTTLCQPRPWPRKCQLATTL
jgi:hypothetical protein